MDPVLFVFGLCALGLVALITLDRWLPLLFELGCILFGLMLAFVGALAQGWQQGREAKRAREQAERTAQAFTVMMNTGTAGPMESAEIERIRRRLGFKDFGGPSGPHPVPV